MNNKKKLLDCLAKTVFISICLMGRMILGVMNDKNINRTIRIAEKFTGKGEEIMTEDTE